MEKGFPESYAKKLAKLHRQYPKWRFTPLLISKLEPQYTWDYVLKQETDEPRRSLVPASPRYAAYLHPTEPQEYDSGFKRASVEIVAYLLDPRNFLNERDIFQFEDLRYNKEQTVDCVKTMLAGGYMETEKLENGRSYARWFCMIGKALDVSPVYLAARVISEHGYKVANLTSGQCGDVLWKYYSEQIQRDGMFAILPPASGFTEEQLKAYNNLYNFFDIEAAGTGRFTIYLNGLKEAQKGTPSMAKEWGGSPAWNTRWKALYGGAQKVAANYVGNYQNTIYLQKWNVDPRCLNPSGKGRRNFWGQFMQNICAPFHESGNIYRMRKQMKILDLPYNFLIPVYEGMPEQTTDPGAGAGSMFPAFVAEEK